MQHATDSRYPLCTLKIEVLIITLLRCEVAALEGAGTRARSLPRANALRVIGRRNSNVQKVRPPHRHRGRLLGTRIVCRHNIHFERFFHYTA